MASNYKQPGDVIEWLNNSGTLKTTGSVVVIGKWVGVALADIANAARGSVGLIGVFGPVPKVSAAVWVAGENLIWDFSTQSFDDNLLTPAAGDVQNAVVAVNAGLNGQTTCEVHLNARIGLVT